MSDLLDATSPTRLTSAALRELAETTGEPVITVSFPTDQATAEPQQNAVRIKSAGDAVEQRLEELGYDQEQQIAPLLQPLEQLQVDDDFWGHQLDGLYVTVWPQGWRAFRVPYELRERVAIDVRAHLQPLLPAVAERGTFHVLALSQHHVRLLRASRSSVERVDLSQLEIPTDLDSALHDDDFEKAGMQSRSGSPGGNRAIWHGHDGGGEHEQVLVDKYLRQVANGLDKLLGGDPRPIVLAGVEEMCVQYRKHTGLTVCDDIVAGNPDDANDAQLRDAAWPIVEPELRRPLDETIETFRAHHGTGLALADLPEILPAAEMGRVGSLLVRDGAERWGRFDPTRGLNADRDTPGEGDEDLVEHAIALVLQRGGDAYLLDDRAMPVDGDLAAVCRY